MSKIDPILNFRILPEVSEHDMENFSFVNEGHTMITKTREAADSSEHSDPDVI